MGYRPSPRPSFDAPTVVRGADAVRHTWGDDEAGLVDDLVYVSSQRLHVIVFALPPGGGFRHSDSFRTIFAADELLHVLQGTLVLANPQTGEVVRAGSGESVFFRRDTWHHGFSYGEDELRVLEFFAPPPATGTSGAYARTKPYLGESVYADDAVVGRLVERPAPRSFRVLWPGDAVLRLDLGVLVGLLVSTEHLTVGTITSLAGRRSAEESHGGDELVYATSGELTVSAGGVEATLAPGDAFSIPAGVAHSYGGAGEAIFGVAPLYGEGDGSGEGPHGVT
jgi:quercetin dioxygenase-like cupin family protein